MRMNDETTAFCDAIQIFFAAARCVEGLLIVATATTFSQRRVLHAHIFQ